MKLLISIFVFSCMVFATVPGYCIENEQGGYWAIYLGGSYLSDMTENELDVDYDMDSGTVLSFLEVIAGIIICVSREKFFIKRIALMKQVFLVHYLLSFQMITLFIPGM